MRAALHVRAAPLTLASCNISRTHASTFLCAARQSLAPARRSCRPHQERGQGADRRWCGASRAPPPMLAISLNIARKSPLPCPTTRVSRDSSLRSCALRPRVALFCVQRKAASCAPHAALVDPTKSGGESQTTIGTALPMRRILRQPFPSHAPASCCLPSPPIGVLSRSLVPLFSAGHVRIGRHFCTCLHYAVDSVCLTRTEWLVRAQHGLFPVARSTRAYDARSRR